MTYLWSCLFGIKWIIFWHRADNSLLWAIDAIALSNSLDDLDDVDGGRRGRKQLDSERRTDDDVDDEHDVAVGRSDEEHGGGCEWKRFDSERMKDEASESAARFGEMCERKRSWRALLLLFSLSVSFSFFYFLFFLIFLICFFFFFFYFLFFLIRRGNNWED